MMKFLKTVRAVVVVTGYGALAWKLWSEYGDRVAALVGHSEDPAHPGAASPRHEPVNIPDDPAIDLPRAVPDPVLTPESLRNGEPLPALASDD